MIGLDANIVVRYIMQDDAKQSARATRLVESLSGEQPGFVPMVALVEVVWVLSSAHELDKAEVCKVLEALLRARELSLERADLVWQALRDHLASSADFADCLIGRCAAAAGCERTLTFDRNAARGTMELLA